MGSSTLTIVISRTIAVHFTNPFHVSTRVVDKCNDGTLLLQVKFCVLNVNTSHCVCVNIKFCMHGFELCSSA
jgi:hypothetical protein